MSKDTIFHDPELDDFDTEVGKENLDELADRIADVDPEGNIHAEPEQKGYFDYRSSEQKKIIKEAAKRGAQIQQQMVKRAKRAVI